MDKLLFFFGLVVSSPLINAQDPIVVNFANCTRDTDVSGNVASMAGLVKLVKDADAKAGYICAPQGDLRKLVDNHPDKLIVVSSDGTDRPKVDVTTTNEKGLTGKFYEEGKPNLLFTSKEGFDVTMVFSP